MPILAEQGIDLEIHVYGDYVVPNTAVEEGAEDANYFQHVPYLDNFNAENGTHLVSVAGVHIEPMGIYAGKTTSLDELSGVLLLHYALARAMAGKEVRTRKALLIIALAADLFCLVYFKYAAFILENLGKLTGTAFSLVELALPLGVSFYLFQSAGYLIDVYLGEEAEKNLIDYAAFTIAFPQLTMGPILRWREWRGALKARTVTREDVFSGFEYPAAGIAILTEGFGIPDRNQKEQNIFTPHRLEAGVQELTAEAPKLHAGVQILGSVHASEQELSD